MNLANEYCHFFDDDAFVETDRAGFRRRVITGERLQLCFWRIKGGATGSFLHHHPDNEQLGIVVRGALDFRIGEPDDERRTVLDEPATCTSPRWTSGTAIRCSSATTSTASAGSSTCSLPHVTTCTVR